MKHSASGPAGVGFLPAWPTAAAPIVVTWVTTSASLLAVVLLPWVILPLVWGSRDGSPRRAAALSGVAVARHGWGQCNRCRRRAARCGDLALDETTGPETTSTDRVVVCCSAGCLLLVAGPSHPDQRIQLQLPSLQRNTVRDHQHGVGLRGAPGASYWLDYYALGGPNIPGAWTIVSSAVVIMGSTAMTALGLAGLCRRIPERFFLVCTLCFGVVVIAIGYVGAAAGPLGHAVQSARGAARTTPERRQVLRSGRPPLVHRAGLPRIGSDMEQIWGEGLITS